jgi:hypothetical protein
MAWARFTSGTAVNPGQRESGPGEQLPTGWHGLHEIQDNGNRFSPNVDAIQEFRLITTNAPAEYGNSMGAIVKH